MSGQAKAGFPVTFNVLVASPREELPLGYEAAVAVFGVDSQHWKWMKLATAGNHFARTNFQRDTTSIDTYLLLRRANTPDKKPVAASVSFEGGYAENRCVVFLLPERNCQISARDSQFPVHVFLIDLSNEIEGTPQVMAFWHGDPFPGEHVWYDFQKGIARPRLKLPPSNSMRDYVLRLRYHRNGILNDTQQVLRAPAGGAGHAVFLVSQAPLPKVQVVLVPQVNFVLKVQTGDETLVPIKRAKLTVFEVPGEYSLNIQNGIVQDFFHAILGIACRVEFVIDKQGVAGSEAEESITVRFPKGIDRDINYVLEV